MLRQSNTLPTKKKKTGVNKLVMGFAALAATAVIGTTGVAAAAQPTTNNANATARNNGNGPNRSGNGYGDTINVGVGIDVNGNNNVISVIVNIFR